MMEINYELTKERYELAIQRIRGIAETAKADIVNAQECAIETAEVFAPYFADAAAFLVKMDELYTKAVDGSLFSMSLAEKKLLNQSLYQELSKENYEKSYCNPAYAVKMLGKEYGAFLAALRAELRSLIAYVYEQKPYP